MKVSEEVRTKDGDVLGADSCAAAVSIRDHIHFGSHSRVDLVNKALAKSIHICTMLSLAFCLVRMT